MSITNPMLVESALIAHISAEIAGLQDVGSFAKYQRQVADQDYPPLPSVYVMPDESQVTDEKQGFQIEDQLWVVSILVDHTPHATDTDTTAIKAGVIMAELAELLIGWRPTYQGSRLAGYEPLQYMGRGTPVYAPGFGEFPVLYKTGMVLAGNN